MHARVSAAIAEQGWARSRIIILDALLKLRQACCDPRLLKQASEGSRTTARSTKEGGPQAGAMDGVMPAQPSSTGWMRCWSSFSPRGAASSSSRSSPRCCSLIQERLAERSIAYSLLTGATRDREAAIRLFEEGAVSVFLVSLKAGGTGLNLIAADTVILYDPWWNPAVEDQAVDRAYRIGQTKPVFVHKLVATGTIEEKMEILKERKSALAQSLFDHDGAPTLAMTQDDLDLLLAS